MLSPVPHPEVVVLAARLNNTSVADSDLQRVASRPPSSAGCPPLPLVVRRARERAMTSAVVARLSIRSC